MPRHPSKGPGWGGPAKGAGNGSEPVPLTTAGPGAGHMSIRGMAKAERIQRWREGLDSIAMDESQHSGARVSALINLLDRDEGKPATVIAGDPVRPLTTIQRVIIDPKKDHTAVEREDETM